MLAVNADSGGQKALWPWGSREFDRTGPTNFAEARILFSRAGRLIPRIVCGVIIAILTLGISIRTLDLSVFCAVLSIPSARILLWSLTAFHTVRQIRRRFLAVLWTPCRCIIRA